MLSARELAAISGCAAADLIGRGGFGGVYRGAWRGRGVAVKRLDAGALQGEREFRQAKRRPPKGPFRAPPGRVPTGGHPRPRGNVGIF